MKPKFKECPVCNVERDVKTFNSNGVCPFCAETHVVPEPEETPATLVNFEVSVPKKLTGVSKSIAVEGDGAEPYTPPRFDEQQAIANPHQELAQRELCRRRLLPFIQRFRPKYTAGWVHKDITRRLERFVKAVENGESPRLLLMCPPRMGKQLADKTPVPTPNGWTTHGELKPGDEVFHPTGRTVRVLAVSEKTPSDVEVRFSDGSSYLCHENHEWVLYNRARQVWQTIETGHFLKNTRFGVRKQVTSGGRSSYQLPTVGPLQYESSNFTMHPYVLGAWLGDGSSGKPCITGAEGDGAIIDKVVDLGYPVSTVCEHSTTKVLTTYFSGTPKTDWPGRMTRELQELGVYLTKRIPDNYQRLTVELRLELLAGLIDTDGTTDKNSRVTFTTVSHELAEDVHELCTGLGFRPYLQEVQPRLSTSGIQGKKTCYVVGFQPTCEIPVALKRKQVTRLANQRRVGLVSVERVSSEEQGHCIQVDSPDGLYVVGKQLTATHNSEIGSRHFPPWVLGQHPDWEIIAASHTSSLTLSFSRYIRDLLRDPAYHSVFPDAKLDPQSQSVENWNLTSGGGYLAAGVGTGITGRGAHILLLDDLVKDIEAADSPTITDNTWEWYGSTAYTRLAPGGGVLGIMTWWSEADWAGRIQSVMEAGEGDKFEIVKYPAINEDGDEFILPDDTIRQFSEHDGEPPEGSVLTRPHNTAVHPERYDTEAMLRIKRNLIATGQKRVWQALYQQNPTPDDGLFFTKEMFRYTPSIPHPKKCHVYQAWDFAITEGQGSDYTVGTTLYQDERDELYVVDVRRFRSSDAGYIVDMILDYAAEYNATTLGFEDGQIWKTMDSQFRKECERRRFYPSFEVLKPLTDKLVRAHPLRGRMQARKIWFPDKAPWFNELYKEMTRFPAGKHDDQIDSLAWAVRLTLTKSAPRIAQPTLRNKSWKDRLRATGSDVSHMAA